MAHDSNTNGIHDAHGRFTAGNKAGWGIAHHRHKAGPWADRSGRKCVFVMPKGPDFDAIAAAIGD